jgi:hypothetical protein
MTNIKVLLAFVSGWFVCGLVTPRFWHPPSAEVVPFSRSTPASSSNATRCDTGVEAPLVLSALKLSVGLEGASVVNASLPPAGFASSDALPLLPRTSSRCEFLWDPAVGCRRPPFKAFDTSRRANTSCLGRLNGLPPVVRRQ